MDIEEIYKDVNAEMDRIGMRVRNHIYKRRELIGMKWKLTHETKVSNTHSCPKNGVKNWLCKRDLPNGYPGWEGRLWLEYKTYSDGFGSYPVEGSLTYTGTGGSGSYDGPFKGNEIYSWDYRFYDSDFPNLEKLIEVANAQMSIYHYDHCLSYNYPTSHTFVWLL